MDFLLLWHRRAPMHPLSVALSHKASHFASHLADLAYTRGLAVTSADGSTRPIPVSLTPVVLSTEALDHRARAARLVAEAVLKVTRALLAGAQRSLVLSALSPLERTLAERTWEGAHVLACTRTDFFVGTSGLKALELNATIPAMQAYSDIAAHSLIDVLADQAGATAETRRRWKSANGSNALALLDALTAGRVEQGGRPPERIGLLCRRRDAQETELAYLARSFQDAGVEASVVYPDQLRLGDAVTADGRPLDILYRHLFVRRLEDPSLAGAKAVIELLSSNTPNAGRTLVLNPPASQLEVKAMFAILSEAMVSQALSAALGLTDEELAVLPTVVPWTRRLVRGATVGPDGDWVTELVTYVAEHPGRFVLKRSWDYGGRAVFIGQSAGDPSFDERVRATYGEVLAWPALCARAADDAAGGGFVVQERVALEPERHVLCTAQGPEAVDLYVDFSLYASLGLARAPAWRGVCRGSRAQVVNIVGGGGVLPVLMEDVAGELHAALTATPSSGRAPS